MFKRLSAVSALSIILLAGSLPGAASARTHARTTTVQGANGGSLMRDRAVSRTPGTLSAQRDVQGSNGRGYATDRNRSCAAGTCSGSATITTNDGRTASRERSATANGDGSADVSATRTGPNGNSQTVSGNPHPSAVIHSPRAAPDFAGAAQPVRCHCIEGEDMKTPTRFALIGLALLALPALLATPAVAQRGGGGMGGMGGMGQLEQADTNGDGVITLAEFKAARSARFDKMDRNGDGVISRDDFGRILKFRPQAGQRIDQLLAEADANHDGRVTRAELDAAPTRIFDLADTNHDGKIDARELAAAKERIDEMRAKAQQR